MQPKDKKVAVCLAGHPLVQQRGTATLVQANGRVLEGGIHCNVSLQNASVKECNSTPQIRAREHFVPESSTQ